MRLDGARHRIRERAHAPRAEADGAAAADGSAVAARSRERDRSCESELSSCSEQDISRPSASASAATSDPALPTLTKTLKQSVGVGVERDVDLALRRAHLPRVARDDLWLAASRHPDIVPIREPVASSFDLVLTFVRDT